MVRTNNKEIWKRFDEIERRFDKIDKNLTMVQTNLTNHLGHHKKTDKWFMWSIPIVLSLINLGILLMQIIK